MRALWLTTPLMMLLAAGCSSNSRPFAKLTGKVLLDGKPLETGTILITSADGGAQDRGLIVEGGAYSVSHAPVGKAKVSIELPPGAKIPPGMEKLTEPEMLKLMVKEKMIPDSLPPEVFKAMVATSKVPPVFQNPTSTLIETTLVEGENTFDIRIPTKVPKGVR